MNCETAGLFGPYSKDYLQIAQILAVTLVAVVGACIAFQQMSVARNKLKLDLFEKRFRVFEATRQFCAAIVREGTMREHQDFVASTIDADFLFNDEIVKYLHELRMKGFVLQEISEQMRGGLHEQNQAELPRKRNEHVRWFYDQLSELRDRFRPFMKLQH